MTLVEVMIAAALAAFILTGVMAAFLMVGRSGYNAANYTMMESEARTALETFSQEARMASDIAWSGTDLDSTTSITLTVVSGTSATTTVIYAFDSSTSGATAKSFYRQVGTTKRVLVSNVENFAFRRYKLVNGTEYPAKNNAETKQIQLTLRSVRKGSTTANASNAVLSARVVLRNKKVTA